MENSDKSKRKPATKPSLRPGDYAIGSPQSRAAARMIVSSRAMSYEPELTFVLCSVVGGCDLDKSSCTRWLGDDGKVHTFVRLQSDSGAWMGGKENLAEGELEAWIARFPADKGETRS